MNIFFLYITGTLLLSCNSHAQPNNATTANDSSHVSRSEATVKKPAVLESLIDPVFKTVVMRITDAKKEKLPGLFPQYSKRQAWNADESLMFLSSDDGSTRLYDGQHYKFLKVLDGVGGEDVFWHPKEKSTIIFSDENKLCSYDVMKEEKTIIKQFPAFTFINTRGEGNLSLDGTKYAFIGQAYDERSQSVSFKKVILFDLVEKKVIAEMSLPKGLENFDWVSISPGGSYVVIDYADNETGPFHGVEVYDKNFHRLWQKPLGAGHSDLGFDENGDEVLIMDCYDANINKTIIKKLRLNDGQETNLLDVSAFFDLHISCRNESGRGWCLISTFNYVERLTDDKEHWLPFENEIFVLKMNGSGEVKRLAHHHSRRYTLKTPDSDNSVYWAEPHATISRKGDRIIWGSNWNEDVKNVQNVDVYVGSFRVD